MKKLIVIATLALMSGVASAQSSTLWYAGADIGSTKVDGLSDNKGSVGVFGGYQFNHYLAAEVGYRALGKVTIDKVEYKLSQAAVSLVTSIPVTQAFGVYARVGYNKLKIDTSVKVSAAESGALYGVGARYAINQAWLARIEYQRPAKDTKNIHASFAYAF